MPPVRRLTAILAADVAGYSRLMGADEEGTYEVDTRRGLQGGRMIRIAAISRRPSAA